MPHCTLPVDGGCSRARSTLTPRACTTTTGFVRFARPGPLPPEGVERFEVSGDIVPLTDPDGEGPQVGRPGGGLSVPAVLQERQAARHGRDARDALLEHRADPPGRDRRPRSCSWRTCRNLAGPRHRDTTFKTIVRTLRQLGYRTADEPAIFSPHLLPPELGGRPQVRERVFILAHYVGQEAAEDEANFDDPIVTPKSFAAELDEDDWDLARDLPLQRDAEVDPKYELESSERKWIETWDGLLTEVAARLDPGERLPGFPIWATSSARSPRPRTSSRSPSSRVSRSRRGSKLPAQERRVLRAAPEVLDRYTMEIDAFPPSRRKFEWQAGPHVPLEETIMHFRPSGIRAKRPDYVPALVAITQTTVLGADRRRLTPRETARLQGLPTRSSSSSRTTSWETPVDQKDPPSYKQMGNGVNVGAASTCSRSTCSRTPRRSRARRCGGERGHQRWLRGASAPPLDLRQSSPIGRRNEVRSLLGVDVLPDPQDPPPGGTQCWRPCHCPGSGSGRPSSCHHSAFACGGTWWSGQPCQKHPSTKTASLARVKAMSMVRRRFPGTLTCTRNLSPRRWSAFRSATSGLVSRRARIDIFADREASGRTRGGSGLQVVHDNVDGSAKRNRRRSSHGRPATGSVRDRTRDLGGTAASWQHGRNRKPPPACTSSLASLLSRWAREARRSARLLRH